MCIDINTAAIVGGNRSRPGNRPGFLIHSEIHKARPDVHAVCHAHTMAGRAWSAFGKPLEMLTQDACDFYNALAVYDDYGGIVDSSEEGRNIAKALGKNNKAAILLSHGLLTVGSTVDEAGFMFGLLERSCAIQLQIEATNLPKRVIADHQAEYNFRVISQPDWLYVEAQPDIEYEIEMAKRLEGGEGLSKGVERMTVDVLPAEN